MKTKKIRAWAIVHKNQIENADYFVANECCNTDETQALAIYATKDDADTMNYTQTHEVIPVLISPIIKRKKK